MTRPRRADSSDPQRFAWWAWAYYLWARYVPPRRGKAVVLRALHRVGLRRGKPFLWRMANGNRVAIRPEEGLVADETVGWTCFLTRRWESHVEQFLQQHLSPGDLAIDVGANLGYFTAVMADAVGPTGRVWSFEPTPPIAADLELSIAANGHDHVDVLRMALAEADGSATMSFDPRVAGSSSLVAAATDSSRAYEVRVRRLDDLYDESQVEPPALIKVDVEGGELGVLRGAVRLLREAQPAVIFEFNADMARTAGWTLHDVVELFESCGPYRLHKLTPAGIEELGSDFVPPAEGFLDLVAVSPARGERGSG